MATHHPRTLLLATAILTLCPPEAQGQGGGPVSETPVLDSIYPASSRRADFVIAIDRSLSMGQFWSETAAALDAMIRSIPDSDHVSIVFFGRSAVTPILPRTLTTASRRALLEELRLAGPPVPMADRFTGSTDLGAAVEAIVGELTRPRPNALQFVFLLTDFIHSPPSGSRWADQQGEAWTSLRGRATTLLDDRPPEVFSLLLPAGGQVGRDLGLVDGVLGQSTRVAAEPGTLREWFVRKGEELQRTRLRRLVERDIESGWSWEILLRGSATELSVRSPTLPLRVAVDTIVTNGARFAPAGPGDFVVAAGGTGRIALPQRPCAPAQSFWRRLLATRKDRSGDFATEFHGRVEITPVEEMALLGLTPEVPTQFPVTASGTIRGCGTPASVQGGLVLLLAVFGLAFWRMWGRPGPLVRGSIQHVDLGLGQHRISQQVPRSTDRTLEIQISGGAALTSEESGHLLQFQVPGVGNTTGLRLQGMRPGPSLRSRRGLYVWATGPGIEYKTATVNPRIRDAMEWRPMPMGRRGALPARPGVQFRVRARDLEYAFLTIRR